MQDLSIWVLDTLSEFRDKKQSQSQYCHTYNAIGNPVTLRVSDHPASSRNYRGAQVLSFVTSRLPKNINRSNYTFLKSEWLIGPSGLSENDETVKSILEWELIKKW